MATSATSSKRCAPTTRPRRSRPRRPRSALPAVVACAFAGACACAADRAPVASCADSLAGTWRLESGADRYHALDTRAAIELHPMFDSADGRPGAGAAAFFFARGSGELTGSYTFWRTSNDGSERVQWPAKLVRCADDRLVIAYRRDGDRWTQLALARD